VRRLRFRQPLAGALLANHRRVAPFGLAGGSPAARGEACILRVDGTLELLGPTARFEVMPGDELTILTPGGGGFGSPA
jgi:5-oxoprolinase (ATP-hydrolysing)